MADFGYFLNSNVSSQTQRRTDIFFSSLGKWQFLSTNWQTIKAVSVHTKPHQFGT
jgi:hypothetical protein